jgi:hypothetical protein
MKEGEQEEIERGGRLMKAEEKGSSNVKRTAKKIIGKVGKTRKAA